MTSYCIVSYTGGTWVGVGVTTMNLELTGWLLTRINIFMNKTRATVGNQSMGSLRRGITKLTCPNVLVALFSSVRK